MNKISTNKIGLSNVVSNVVHIAAVDIIVKKKTDYYNLIDSENNILLDIEDYELLSND